METISLKSISREETLRYMGHRGEASGILLEALEKCEKALLDAVKPGFVFKVFDIEFKPQGIEVCKSSLLLCGSDIRSHLDGCKRAAFVCATLGADVDRLIRTFEVKDISSAFVMDAMASAAIEEVCRISDERIKEQLPDSFFTWRFSPGYGDFPIDIQENFLRMLDAQKRIGVCASESGILIPRKSVTAVSGISESPLPQKRRGCACCNMAKECAFRKRGEHCGI
ncbi:MAG: methionine synthase [Clostridium sp.]|nr:methionine synthase [Clostridium sp.]MCM1546753.1 methionine synthase [Ruminococcus sp.]